MAVSQNISPVNNMMKGKKQQKAAKNKQPKQRQEKRPSTPTTTSPTQDLNAATNKTLFNPTIPRQQRQQLAQQVNQKRGNQYLNRLLHQPHPNLLQRDDGPDVGTDTTTTPALPTFDQAEYPFEGDNFDATYHPTGPAPEMGHLQITHWVHIDFIDFNRSWLPKGTPYTAKQLADFHWSDDEKEQFTGDFMTSVHDAWSDQHVLQLNDPTFSTYRCRVSVNVISTSDADMAHTKITVRKYPAGTERFRSEADEEDALLDSRDASELETDEVARERPFIRQVGDFGFDSEAIEGDLSGQVEEIDELIEETEASPTAQGQEWRLNIVGVASSEGSKAYNEKLGQRRADTVENEISADLGWIKEVRVESSGEEGTTTEERFRMVIVTLRTTDMKDVTQNVAAHEFGHMLGLDDEYVDMDPEKDRHRFPGDKPDYFGEVETEISLQAANETLTADSESIMSAGSKVLPAHYLYFLQAIEQMTGNSNWQIIE